MVRWGGGWQSLFPHVGLECLSDCPAGQHPTPDAKAVGTNCQEQFSS